jgi:YegS/Rv2252/BmrU family lipid kinase
VALRTLVVVNPASGGGAARRRFERALPRLRDVLGECDVAWTGAPRDAERIAREGVRAGVERIVVAGGDGTMSEVVSGLLAAGLGGYVELALLPLGTGGDLRRTLALPADMGGALAAIARGERTALDAGRVSYVDRSGRDAVSYFANIASLGISGLTTELVNHAPKALGGRLSFLFGTLRSIASYRAAPVALRVDGDLVHEGPLVLAAAANGRFFGGGMEVAPRARPDDGLLDVVAIPGFGKLRLLSELPRIYRGSHLDVPGVVWRRGAFVEAEPLGEPPWVEIDGEPLGRLPARIEVLPKALTVVGCGALAR